MQVISLLLLAVLLLSSYACVEGASSKASVEEKQKKYAKRTGEKFLAEVARRPGIIRLKSGMLVEVLKESDKGDAAKSPTESDSW